MLSYYDWPGFHDPSPTSLLPEGVHLCCFGKRICIYLPGGPYHKKTSGKMSFFPLKSSTSEESPDRTTLACQTLHWSSCCCWHVCHSPWFLHLSIQTSTTNLSCSCNKNQLTWSRGELFGLDMLVWSKAMQGLNLPLQKATHPDPYSPLMWEISLWVVLQ